MDAFIRAEIDTDQGGLIVRRKLQDRLPRDSQGLSDWPFAGCGTSGHKDSCDREVDYQR